MTSITYLLGSLCFFIVWIILFILRKDLRKPILILSCIIAFSGMLITGLVWTRDWWVPNTLTSTPVGLEDFIFGFSMGGIVLSIYVFIFNKKIVDNKKSEENNKKNASKIIQLQLYAIILSSLLIGGVASLVFGLKSWIAWLIATIIPTFILYTLRTDLIKQSIWTGVIIAFLSIPVYWLMHIIEPGYVARWWISENMTGMLFLGIPIEDILWFITTGMFLGPLYWFWSNKKIE